MKLLLLLLAGCAASPRAAAPASALDIRGRTLAGEVFSLRTAAADVEGVVVSFGASWCQPCVLEWPGLAELEARYRDRGILFVIVLLDEAPEILPKLDRFFHERLKIGFPAIVGDPEVAIAHRVDRLPDTMLLDGDGAVVWREVGYRATTMEDLGDRLDRLLSAKRGP